MDALQQAREAMAWTEEEFLVPDAAPWYFAKAKAYAAVAQAEQLKRIADALENLSGAYTTATFGAMPQDNPE